LKVLRVAAEGARVGNANLTDVTNALDAAIVSGISGVQNYKQGMGALNAIVGAGDMKMQDLADALGTGLLAPMKTYGLTLKDVGGALAVFGDNNIRGQDAATKLTSAVRIMAAPSAAASKPGSTDPLGLKGVRRLVGVLAASPGLRVSADRWSLRRWRGPGAAGGGSRAASDAPGWAAVGLGGWWVRLGVLRRWGARGCARAR
jgi:hypothetical protein